MTIHKAIKMMNGWAENTVPAAGEICIDPKTNKVRIGDGTTSIVDLPWILDVDPITEPSHKYNLSSEVKKFIEQYIDLIEENRFDEIYAMISHSSIEFIRDLTRVLLEAGLNPKPYLATVPRCIQDLLLDKVDNIDNNLYTYDYERDATFERVQQQLARVFGIPSSILTVGGLD